MKRHRAVAAALLAMSTAAAADAARPKKADASAVAQVPPEAQQRFQRALDLYDEGNLDAARTELARAYDIAPHFKLLYNMGQIAFELHDYPAALAAFEKYLSEGGAKIPEARRQQVESDLEKLRARVARLEVVADVAQAEVRIDDATVGSTPLAAPLIVGAGRRKVSVIKNGATATRWVDLAGGDSTTVELGLIDLSARGAAPAPATAAAPVERSRAPSDAPPRASSPFPWGWTITGAFAVTAGVTGTLAYMGSRDLRDERLRLTSRDELDRKAVEVRNLALVADLTAGASVVAAVITLLTTTSRSPAAHETSSVRIVPSFGQVRLLATF